MTKERILEVFEDINLMYNNPNMYDDLSKMLDELVEDSKKSVESETFGDCISRQAVMKLLEKEDWADTVYGVLNLPSVTPQPKIGRWIFERQWSDWFEETYKCSRCNRKIIVPSELSGEELYEKYPYCHCGAKMEVEDR